jgi:hypothetical protein
MQAQRMQQTAADTRQASSACYAELTARDEFAGLGSKLYLGDNTQYPLSYLSDKSKPSKKELQTLFRLHAGMQPCRKIILDGASKMHPLILAAIVESYAESDKIWVEAATGKLTCGLHPVWMTRG